MATDSIVISTATIGSSSFTPLPSPIVLEMNNELIWSSNTGRSVSATDAGKMIGDVIALKRTVHIEWGVLTSSEFASIKDNMPQGFFQFRITLGSTTETFNVYRGTIARAIIGAPNSDNETYSTAKVDVIEQ